MWFGLTADYEGAQLGLGIELPHLDFAVPAAFCGCQARTVGAPTHGGDVRTCVSPQGVPQLAGFGVPDPNGQVVARRSQTLTVRAPAERALKSLHQGIVDEADFCVRDCVPDSEVLVRIGTGNLASIGTPAHGTHLAVPPLQCAQFFAAVGVPDFY